VVGVALSNFGKMRTCSHMGAAHLLVRWGVARLGRVRQPPLLRRARLEAIPEGVYPHFIFGPAQGSPAQTMIRKATSWRAARAASRSDGRRNFPILDPLDFLAEFTQHIPPTGAHLIRYYGWYSNKARGLRRKASSPEMRKRGNAGQSPICCWKCDRVALGGCPPRAPTDPNVRN